MKICVYSENLSRPFDEGIKKTAYMLIRELSKENDVLGLCRYGNESDDPLIKVISSNKLLLSLKLKKEIRTFTPEIILYIPITCGTIFSLIRNKALKLYGKSAKNVMILLQPRPYTFSQKQFIRLLKPDLILTPSPQIIKILSKLNFNVKFISLGVDIEKFSPLGNQEEKENLRYKYDLPKDKFIFLHVGHINNERNIGVLGSLQIEDSQVVIVSSTSTSEVSQKDVYLQKELMSEGVVILDKYVEKIEEIYQLSDCYVFPVMSEKGCIGIPLSILEAMACNLPIISTKFGGLPRLFKEKNGFMFAEDDEELLNKINLSKKISEVNTRKNVLPFSWQNVIKEIL